MRISAPLQFFSKVFPPSFPITRCLANGQSAKPAGNPLARRGRTLEAKAPLARWGQPLEAKASSQDGAGRLKPKPPSQAGAGHLRPTPPSQGDGHLRPKHSFKKGLDIHPGPKGAQEDPRGGPTQEGSKRAPRGLQEGLRNSPPQYHTKNSWYDTVGGLPKGAREPPRRAPRGPQKAPRGPQQDPKRASETAPHSIIRKALGTILWGAFWEAFWIPSGALFGLHESPETAAPALLASRGAVRASRQRRGIFLLLHLHLLRDLRNLQPARHPTPCPKEGLGWRSPRIT